MRRDEDRKHAVCDAPVSNAQLFSDPLQMIDEAIELLLVDPMLPVMRVRCNRAPTTANAALSDPMNASAVA